MSENQKKILGSLVFVLVTILIGYLLYLFFFKSKPVPSATIDDTFVVTDMNTSENLEVSQSPRQGSLVDRQDDSEQKEEAPPVVVDSRVEVKRLARAFAERYGSFSSESDYQNLIDLKVFMTNAMQSRTDAFVEDARAKGPSSVPFGTTTRSLIVKIDAFDENLGTATVIVTTQRSATSGDFRDVRVYYQDITLEFTQVDEVWKVNSANWDDMEREL